MAGRGHVLVSTGAVLLCCAGVGRAQDGQFDYFVQRMVFGSYIESLELPPSAGIDATETLFMNVEEALRDDPSRLDAVRTAVGADPVIAGLAASPQWLHGMDVVVHGRHDELPGGPQDASPADGPLATTIWVAGWDGLMLRSDDDGANWQPQETGTGSHLQAVDFVDEAFGLAAGHDGMVLRTHDGGHSWELLRTDPAELHRSVDCIDRLRCWLAGEYPHVYRSTDGGLTWLRGEGVQDVGSLKMLSPELGVAGGRGRIWRSEDGGASWASVQALDPYGLSDPAAGISGIDSASGLDVWAVGRLGGEIAILRSGDGGRSWENQSANILPAEHMTLQDEMQRRAHRATAVRAVSPYQAYVAATNGLLLATVDGGETWLVQLATGDPAESFHALAMRDGRVGWAAGNMGEVVGTGSGGLGWVPLRGIVFQSYATAAALLGLERGVESVHDMRRMVAQGDLEAAAALGDRLAAKTPGDAGLVLEVAGLHFDLAAMAAEEGDNASAIAHYGRVIDLREGKAASAYNNRAIAHAREGALDLALADVDAAIALRPDDSLSLANRCLVLRLSGRLPEALFACDAAVAAGLPEKRPSRVWVMLQRALVRRAMGDLDGAVADFGAVMLEAVPEVIERAQELLADAGVYEGPVTGDPSVAFAEAVERCVRDDACFAGGLEGMADLAEFLE